MAAVKRPAGTERVGGGRYTLADGRDGKVSRQRHLLQLSSRLNWMYRPGTTLAECGDGKPGMYHGEKLNSITHLVGSALALVGLGALLTVSILQRDPWMIASFSVFGVTLVLLYTMSTLYHSFYPPSLKRLFQKMDHIAIYLLIAGTYAPFMLVSLRGNGGPLLLALVWVLAALGILLDVYSRRRNEALQLLIYLAMGWVALAEAADLRAALTGLGFLWLAAGGLCYTLGIVFYVLDHHQKMRHAHGIWHLFVMFGSICHFIAVLAYVR